MYDPTRLLPNLRSQAQLAFGEISILIDMAEKMVADGETRFSDLEPDYLLRMLNRGKYELSPRSFISFISSIANDLILSYHRKWRLHSKNLRSLFVYHGEPIDSLERVIQCYDLPSPYGSRTLEDLRHWREQVACVLSSTEVLFRLAQDRIADFTIREFEDGIIPPGELIYHADIPLEFPKGETEVEVKIDGKPHPVTHPYWKLLLALQNARPNGLTKDQLESVNQNARRMHRHLEKLPRWFLVIGRGGVKGSGYRLM